MQDLTIERTVDVDAEALPSARGPFSARMLDLLTDRSARRHPARIPDDPLGDDDLHLALGLAYDLSYRGLPGVRDDLEWDLAVLGLRRDLEEAPAQRAPDPIPILDPLADRGREPVGHRQLQRRAHRVRGDALTEALLWCSLYALESGRYADYTVVDQAGDPDGGQAVVDEGGRPRPGEVDLDLGHLRAQAGALEQAPDGGG